MNARIFWSEYLQDLVTSLLYFFLAAVVVWLVIVLVLVVLLAILVVKFKNLINVRINWGLRFMNPLYSFLVILDLIDLKRNNSGSNEK